MLTFGIFDNESGVHIGNIKYEPINFDTKNAIMGVLIGDENWRGKGVVKEVTIHCNQWLLQKGIKNIFLGVDKDNLNAIKAYRKTGFAITSAKTPIPQGEKYFVMRLLITKKIKAKND